MFTTLPFFQEKIDKYEGTFDKDPDYKTFLIKLSQPEMV